ncbi:MAG: tetratricopeptide repeat protein [Candidatus Heimdallarchaeota archaeon]
MAKISFDKVKKSLKIDDFLSAKKFIETIELESLSPKEKISWLLLKGEIQLGLGQLEEAQQFVEEALKKSVDLSATEQIVDSYILKLRLMSTLARDEKFLLILNVAERSLGDISEKSSKGYLTRKAHLQVIKGGFFEKKGNYDDAMSLYESALQTYKKLKLDKEVLSTQSKIVGVFSRKGEYEAALSILSEILPKAKKLPFKRVLMNIYNRAGIVSVRNGQINQAKEYYAAALEIALKLGNQRSCAGFLNNLGLVHFQLGDYHSAIDYFERSLANLTPPRDDFLIAIINYNLAIIYREQGKLDKSLEKMLIGLEVAQKEGNITNIMDFMNSIGKVYHLKGDFDEALKYLQLAYQVRDKNPNKLSISRTVYYLINLSIDLNKIALAKDYFADLKRLAKNEKNLILQQRTQIAEALLLKLETRSRYRVRAEELFNEIINGPIIDNELYVDALLNLTEMLLLELKMTGNEELLQEVKELTTKLLKMAEKQSLSSLLAEVYWLQSQIALLESDIPRSRRLLSQAESIAAELGFKRLGYHIAQQHDRLLDQIESWEFLMTQNAPLIERMETIKLDEFLLELFKRRAFDIPPLPAEEPIMLLLLNESGAPIFSKNFTSEERRIDDALISGFLTAINAFLSETLESKGIVERIKYNEYNMIIQSFDSFMLCYIFIGQSFSAMQHVTNIINFIKKDDALRQSLLEQCESAKPLNRQKELQLQKIIDSVFLSPI